MWPGEVATPVVHEPEQDVLPFGAASTTMSAYRNAPLSSGHDYRDLPASLYLPRGIRHRLQYYVPYLRAAAQGAKKELIRIQRGERQWKSLLNIPTALILIWILALWWGEVGTFRSSVNRCDWHNWERWVCPLKPPLMCGLRADATHSPKVLLLTTSFSLQTLSWLIHIPILAAHGQCLPLLDSIQTTTCANHLRWSKPT